MWMSFQGTTGVRYGLSSAGSKFKMSSVASFPAFRASYNKRDCSSRLSPKQSMAGCTAHTQQWMVAEAPHTKVQSRVVDVLKDFQTMVCTSLQACWYSSERVWVAA